MKEYKLKDLRRMYDYTSNVIVCDAITSEQMKSFYKIGYTCGVYGCSCEIYENIHKPQLLIVNYRLSNYYTTKGGYTND